MANPERGEVEIVVNDRPYTLKLSTNAAVSFEEKEKKTIGQLLMEAQALSFKSIRYFLWLLLQTHHAEEFKKLSDVGTLIDDGGGIAKFLERIMAMAEINQKAQQEALKNGGEKAADPLDAQADGTGEPSIAMPDE
jgi:hypothetical protein